VYFLGGATFLLFAGVDDEAVGCGCSSVSLQMQMECMDEMRKARK
jgi:hypothetical protein